MRFNIKVVFITGGGSGIGAATVENFLKEGAKVAIFDHNLPEYLGENSNLILIEGDVRKAKQIENAVYHV